MESTLCDQFLHGLDEVLPAELLHDVLDLGALADHLHDTAVALVAAEQCVDALEVLLVDLLGSLGMNTFIEGTYRGAAWRSSRRTR